MKKKDTTLKCEAVLESSWGDFVTKVPKLTEAECKLCLAIEVANAGKKRRQWVERLHQRYCRLRTKRERAELIAKLPKSKRA